MRAVLVLALMLLAPGCQYDPHAHLLTTVRPEPSEVVGRYTLVKQTVIAGDLAAMNGRLCVVELRADGAFFADRLWLISRMPMFSIRLLAHKVLGMLIAWFR